MAGDLLIYGLADPRTRAIHYIGKSRNGMKRPRAHGWASGARGPEYIAKLSAAAQGGA